MKLMFGINYIALSGLNGDDVLSVGRGPTLKYYIPSGFSCL